MINLILVDDHDIVRAGIRRLLENQMSINVIGDFGSGEEAYQFLRKNSADVVVMDLSMPGWIHPRPAPFRADSRAHHTGLACYASDRNRERDYE